MDILSALPTITKDELERERKNVSAIINANTYDSDIAWEQLMEESKKLLDENQEAKSSALIFYRCNIGEALFIFYEGQKNDTGKEIALKEYIGLCHKMYSQIAQLDYMQYIADDGLKEYVLYKKAECYIAFNNWVRKREGIYKNLIRIPNEWDGIANKIIFGSVELGIEDGLKRLTEGRPLKEIVQKRLYEIELQYPQDKVS